MDKQNQHGGPAFPKAGIELEKDTNGSDREIQAMAQDGMTLRDYIAVKAMHAALANSGAYWSIDTDLGRGDAAKHAYAMADAMLKARNA